MYLKFIDENRIQKLNMYLLSSSDPLNHQYEQQYEIIPVLT